MPIATPMHRTLIADGYPAGGTGGPLEYLAHTFRLDDGSGATPPATRWRHEAGKLQALERALAVFRQGAYDGAAVVALREELRSLVETAAGCFSCALDADRRQEVVLACQGDVRLLTDLPWEMLPLGPIPGARLHELVEGSLASRPFVRGLRSVQTAPARRASGRLRILPCIANPPSPAGATAAAYAPVDLAGFAQTIKGALLQFPQIELLGEALALEYVTTNALRSQIEHLRPHLLLIVAHGSSAGSEPELLFADGALRIRSLAAMLRRTPDVIAGFLISCDTARTPQGIASAAASTLISEAGLAEVVVMQGKVNQDVARYFLRGFLTSLLVQRSLAMAVADGRLEIKSRPHAFFPTIFRNLSAVVGEPTLGTVIDQYQASLRQLGGGLAVPRERLIGRRKLGRLLAPLLAAKGLLLVDGPWGSGKTTMLKTVLAEILSSADQPAGRPAFYVDCRAPESEPATPAKVEEVLGLISKQVNDLATACPGLLPEAATVSFAGVPPEAALLKIDRWQAIVVLDHVQIPSTGALRPAWNLFLVHAATLTRSLVVITRSTPPAPGTPRLHVPYFTARETGEYARLNQLRPATQLYQYTGGAPLLLNAVRDLNQAQSPVDLARPGLLSPGAIGRVYDRTIKAALSGAELDQLARLLWLGGPVEEQLLGEYVFPEDPAATARFRALGLLVGAHDENPTRLAVPGFAREAILIGAKARRASAEGLFTRLVVAAGADVGAFVRKLFDRPSGAALVVGFQRAALHLGNRPAAESLAFFAAESKFGTTRQLQQLFAAAHLAGPRTAAPGISIRALRLSTQLGFSTVRFERDIAARRDLSAYDRARFRAARADARKDRDQALGKRQVWADLNYVIGQASQPGHNRLKDAELRQDWRDLWATALEKRIHLLLFLEGKMSRQVAGDMTQLRKLIGPGDRYGNTLASLIERELKVGAEADWGRITEWLEECDGYFATSSNHRYLGFFHYQRGQYFRQKPNPDLREALSWYVKSEEEERLAGEPRRWALALFRRMEIGWGHLHTIEGARALEEIREAVVQVEAKHGDSLTLRVQQRLFALQAEIELQASLGPGTGVLEAACVIGASPRLHGERDALRFKANCHRCLSLYLARASTRAAADFVRRFAGPIRRKLGLRLSAANVEAALAKLSPTTKD